MIPEADNSDAPASILMANLADRLDQDRVSVGDLVDHMNGRAQGLLLLVLSLPMCIPNIPGISTLFGILLLAPSLQMMFGQSSPWAPRAVRAWTFNGNHLRKALRGSARVLAKVERFSKPRLRRLTQWPLTGIAGFQTLLMALVLILPMWGANLLPGIAVTLTGLSIIQRDGIAMIASTIFALGSIAWVYAFAKYALDFMHWLWRAAGIVAA